MTDAQPFLNELSKQKARIQNSIDQISSGNIPNMQEIDRDLSTLAGAIQMAPPAVAKQTEHGLRELISLLEDLAGRIQDFQSNIQDKE